MLEKVLIVEDSSMVMKIIRHVAQQQNDFDFYYAEDFAQAKKLVVEQGHNFFAALVDLNLPDAPDGEVVDYALKQKINTIVLTASFDETKRSKLLDKGIVDYVTKEGRFSYEYALNLVRRIAKNRDIKVLIVDDSDTSRFFVGTLLSHHLFQIFEARNGMEAVQILLDNPDIELMITDYNMPKMDGAELVRNIRHKYEKSEMAIIGLSADGDSTLSAKFIKNGANDFLRKPFNHEEFHCRIRHNIEAIEHVKQIRAAADRDYLTGVYNRRYFFSRGEALYQQAVSNSTPLAAVILDVDNFKQTNDTYGYEGGDYLLREFSKLLNDALGRFLLARPSGEEFFMLLPGLDNSKAMALLSSVREIVSGTAMFIGDDTIYMTFSAGITNQLGGSLQEQLSTAGGYLSRAKEAGKNLIIGDDGDEAGD